jgi:ubiquinone/menaquinone biosynthesis C-methylase UbiE
MRLNPTRALRKIYFSVFPDAVGYSGLTLPEKQLRTGGLEFQDDAFFVQSAQGEAKRAIDHLYLSSDQQILDVGCGFGRLAIGLIDILPNVSYVGLDVNPVAIEWCQRYIEKKFSSFHFIKLNVKNDRYNPSGEELNSLFHFPLPVQSFNAAYLYSVFSHMEQKDIEIYLHELHRVLDKNGRLFFTAFAEKNVPDMTINPPNYRNIEWKNALHCVRYNFDYLHDLIQKCGFQLDEFIYEQETNGQSAFYVSIEH